MCVMAPVSTAEIQLLGQDYEAYFQIAEGCARRQGVNPNDVQDIAQIACMKLVRRGGVPQPTDGTTYSPSGYVNRVTINAIISSKRGNHVETYPRGEEDLDAVTKPIPSTEDQWMNSIANSDLKTALGNLSDQQREIVLLSAAGYRYKEISEQLSIPLGTVQSSLHRAKNEIKRQLDNRGDL